MASLRARLVAGLLALAAVGLLALGGITYAAQRSFLYQRADEQAERALLPLDRVLDGRGRVDVLGPGGRGDRGRDGPPGGADPGFGLPPGTFGQRRSASGEVLASVALTYGATTSARPVLPADLPVGRLLTVEGAPAGAPRYRVLAAPSPMGGLTVAAIPLREVDQTLHRLLLVEALVILGVLVVLGLLAGVLVRIGLLPLARMEQTAGAIAGGDLSQRVRTADPRTEVGRLGLALNRMLDRLDAAFAERRASEERLRRFIADASHELRTPLASIRGYAELFRIGAAREPAETERAMRRIEEEAARMGVLVEDLLTLARLDELRAAAREEVDLARLAADAVDDARATAPERDVSLRATGPAVVSGDADRLRQVLANLLRNALVHTPPGTPVAVTVARTGGEVVLEVRDRGPGLPVEDGDVLFERFWRAEGGRARGRGGAGLGLAIVAAVVAAHGGTVAAANAPGGGAAFTVRLPAAPRPAEPPGARSARRGG